MSDSLNLPDFDDLPSVKDMPKGCAWGVFDKDGKKDVFGTLNLLTPSVVKAAAAEVKDGVSVSLNWPIGAIKTPGFGRKGLVHKVISFNDGTPPMHGYDDEVEFNTQCSSQWDSLCHFHHQPSASGYNGCQTSVEELLADKDHKLPNLTRWQERGGLVGRGVLLDYKAYADAKNITVEQFDKHVITIKDLEDIAQKQGTELRAGDILIVRSGFTEALSAMSGDEQDKALGTHRTCGVEGNEEAAKWFWNKHFSAVAGDMIAFEHIPPVVNGEERPIADLVLHQYFLGLFGLHIGELWDLKALSEYCAKTKRYSFLLTSSPLNVPGGIGSPPNALAIF